MWYYKKRRRVTNTHKNQNIRIAHDRQKRNTPIWCFYLRNDEIKMKKNTKPKPNEFVLYFFANK